MLRPDYPIVTERLLLRPLDPDVDAEALAVYQSQPDVCRYVPYAPRGAAEIADMLRAHARSTLEAPGDVISLAVVLRETGRVVGDVVLIWTSDLHRSGEFGYVVDPAHQGHGYATEACRALLRLAFDELDLHRMVGRIDERNQASAAVLAKLGLRREARLVENEWFKGDWSTEIGFAILASEWRAGQPD